MAEPLAAVKKMVVAVAAFESSNSFSMRLKCVELILDQGISLRAFPLLLLVNKRAVLIVAVK